MEKIRMDRHILDLTITNVNFEYQAEGILHGMNGGYPDFHHTDDVTFPD